MKVEHSFGYLFVSRQLFKLFSITTNMLAVSTCALATTTLFCVLLLQWHSFYCLL